MPWAPTTTSGRSSSTTVSSRSESPTETRPSRRSDREAKPAMLLTSALISGIGLGSMYGLIALGFYLTYAVSSTVNFAQGSSMMLGAVFAYTFAVKLGWHFIPAAAMSLILCAVYGLLVEIV